VMSAHLEDLVGDPTHLQLLPQLLLLPLAHQLFLPLLPESPLTLFI
jgi:hypothetical protein